MNPSKTSSSFAKDSNNPQDFLSFGDVARGKLGQQCQYACRYTGIDTNGKRNPAYWQEMGYVDLGENLRFIGNTNNYHSLQIHKDDVAAFVARHHVATGNERNLTEADVVGLAKGAGWWMVGHKNIECYWWNGKEQIAIDWDKGLTHRDNWEKFVSFPIPELKRKVTPSVE